MTASPGASPGLARRGRRHDGARGVTTPSSTTLLAIDDDESWFRNVVKRQARRGRGDGDETTCPACCSWRSTASPTTSCSRDAGWQRPRDGGVAARGLARAAPLGDRLVVADRRLPGRPAPRRQRRHAGLPLVGEGPRRGDGDEPAARRDGARAPPLQRSRAAVRRRGQPRQHPLRRRAPPPPDHEHRRSSATVAGGSARTTSPTSPTPTRHPYDRPSRPRDRAASCAPPAAQRREDVQPRIERGCVYSIMRAWATVVQRDLQVEAVIADVYAGRPVTYTTFLAYDEVAHHSGIERPETLDRPPAGSTTGSAASPPRPRTPRARTASSSSPTTASRRVRRSSTATASAWRSSCATPPTRRPYRPRHGRQRGARLPRRRPHRGGRAGRRRPPVRCAVPPAAGRSTAPWSSASDRPA